MRVMDFRKINTFTGLFFILLIGGSMVFSTLHSHHEVEWNHPERHLSTGHCLTTDSAVCPISGYLFKADFTGNIGVEPHYLPEAIIISRTEQAGYSFTHLFDLGRSPPFVAV